MRTDTLRIWVKGQLQDKVFKTKAKKLRNQVYEVKVVLLDYKSHQKENIKKYKNYKK